MELEEKAGKDSYFQELRANLDMDRNKIISMLTDAEDSASKPASVSEIRQNVKQTRPNGNKSRCHVYSSPAAAAGLFLLS